MAIIGQREVLKMSSIDNSLSINSGFVIRGFDLGIQTSSVKTENHNETLDSRLRGNDAISMDRYCKNEKKV